MEEKELSKVYNPKDVEEKIYETWQENGYFHAEVDNSKKPFTIVMPPPNITGKLHMGHALDETMQDIIIRFKRMQGYNALWVPGTDHASIATEAKISEQLRKEGINKDEMTREEFLNRAWAWKEEYGGNIVSQIKKLGSSCDWSRQRFTLDEGCTKAVREFFVRLYEKGLIYKGERLINWCPKCKTSISDSEVEFEEKDGHFWHIKYKIENSDECLTVATTRPETMFGDVALAVNPNDERYQKYVGKNVIIPVVGRVIPVIADEYVDIEVGTGVLKITPAHDPNDFEVGARHNLPILNVMNDDATMNENAGEYEGLDRYAARKKLVENLKIGGYLSQIKDIKHNVGTCYRCSSVVEPRISNQWFVKMKDLAKPAIECVKSGTTSFIPERFSKIYYHWLENIKDWCISRQLWWGHRIPVWYCDDCGHMNVSRDDVKKCEKCSSENIHQDEDTLDTWFSSGLWPFSVLGWPEKTPELDYFYPTNVLVTGYDIIFFWVVKMVFSSLAMTDHEPFKNILIHGLVRDSQGRKMSKSLGNGVDPLEIIEKYGADALRFSLMMGNSPGNDLRFFNEKVESCRNFANKIWNAARFVHMNIDGKDISGNLPENMSITDRWIVSRLSKMAKEVTECLEKFELGVAAQKLYDFIWDEFCDWYIEFSKISGDKNVLLWTVKNILALLHPFMPFITEEIWQSFPHEGETLMLCHYPEYNENLTDESAEESVKILVSVIKSVRNMRREKSVPHGKKIALYIETENSNYESILNENSDILTRLAGLKSVSISRKFDVPQSITIINDFVKIYVPIDDIVDRAEETVRLQKERESTLKQLEQVENRLKDEKFISRAPQKIIDGAKENAETLRQKLKKIEQSIEDLK
ncbi:MAG: valine--tRNA ligase [Clostridia bacterium]|nr:valine--tRNA ligase [Clostridia bacterium]